jgi:hypothetical protein
VKTHTDVAIIGAGPYGLSIAAHLRECGVDFRIVGRPMHSWLNHMPKGMLLKSPGFASSLHDPARSFTIGQFCMKYGIPYADVDAPIPLETFCAYGLAFQNRFAPHLEEDTLASLMPDAAGFALQLESGAAFTARNVVLAIGLDYFRQMPAPLRRLPSAFVSHSAAHRDPSAFTGREVAVIGGGASATDLAVLLHEANASVDLVVRKEALDFGRPWLGTSGAGARSLWRRLREPLSGIGPGWRSRLCADFPGAYRYLPEEFRLRTARTHLGPSGGWFMKERAAAVPTLLGCRLDNAAVTGNRIRLLLLDANGCKRYLSVDHVIAATGYHVDLRRLTFLHNDIRRHLRLAGGSPQLSAHFESSMPGLYFAGPIAAASFGPVMRFVAGAGFAARRVSQRLARLPARDDTRPAALPAVELES